ncbi:MAG: TlpA disulfide reductase family protein [Alloprevotella sp.]|nr:TlpA disulfide reductase family protein [Alloprevotella sp.]
MMKKLCLLFMAFLAFGASMQANDAMSVTIATPAPQKAIVKTLPAHLTGEKLLAAIKKNYEGRVALVDFWATWCGPCRMAMKEIDKIKPTYINKGVAFVYITGETSPLNTWQEMLPSIDGDHYRLTKTQWESLGKLLNITGIPAYLLLNKDGSTAYDNLTEGGYPGNELIQNNIEVALTK